MNTVQIGVATYRGKPVAVTLETWEWNGRTLYTPKCSEMGLGSRHFARRSAAIKYAKQVSGMREVA